MSQDRRTWTPAEKLRIVMAGLQKDVEVADLCRQEGISATQYYQWKNQLLSSAARIFEDGRKKKKRPGEEARKEAKIQRMERVIAEITAENLDLKKGLLD